MNSGLNTIFELNDVSSNEIVLTYNIYVENTMYPKSKQLNIYFDSIKIEEKIIEGKWEVNLDVPEIMYNREDIFYKVVSCENDNFEIYTAKVTSTGFELGITISNIEEPVCPDWLKEQEHEIFSEKGVINTSDEYSQENSNEQYITTTSISSESVSEYYENSLDKELYEEYYTKKFPIGNIRENYISWISKTDGNYILDSNNNKFLTSTSLGKTGKYEFIDGNKFDIYETFNMTKYDATDEIKVIIEFYGEPITIELERVKQ